MRRLPLPTIAVHEILADCIGGTNDSILQQRLSAIEPALISASGTYHQQAVQASLHSVIRVNAVGAVTKEELKGLYTAQMSSANGAARWAYDILRNSAPHKRCPLCGVGTVATLDHHLPKSKYPNLSVSPLNLVPACHYCNDSKGQAHPTEAGHQTIHPYYDDFTQSQWLFAEIVAGLPVAITYRVDPPLGWNNTDRERVQRHFAVCKLGVLFISNANDDLVTLKAHLVRLFDRGGASLVQLHLADEALRYSRHLNSWQHAMYSVLAQDDWFTSGGFHDIAD
ncbi:HNH endonuclease [Rhizobium leguminosarum]|uniref:HNH endonuclease n=1 Tax=Rhizobium leguminosarum TaxID=384 RepID=UPI003F94C812